VPGGERPPHDTTPRWGEAGIHGIARARRWDVVTTVSAHGLADPELEFVALPDGSLLAGDAQPEAALRPLADAVERELQPPYRAQGVNRGGGLWAVAARGIEVLELPQLSGEELSLVVGPGGERTLTVDGMPSFAAVPELDRLASARFRSYVVHGERLLGELWEIQLAPL